MDSRAARRYFSQLDAYLAGHGFDSLDALRRRVDAIEGGALVYALVLGLIGAIAAVEMVALALPVLMMWMILVVFGVGLTVLGMVHRWRQRQRIVGVLREWESAHALRPVAQALYGQARPQDIPLHVRWVLNRRGQSALDWMRNYAGAMAELRAVLEGHGAASPA